MLVKLKVSDLALPNNENLTIVYFCCHVSQYFEILLLLLLRLLMLFI